MSSENGLDCCQEEVLDPKTDLDAQITNVVTKSKEPAVDQDNDKNESGVKEEVVSESSAPKKRGRKPKKVKNESKQNASEESKADKEVDNFDDQLLDSTNDKKKENIAENTSNGEIKQENEVFEKKEKSIEPVSDPKLENRKKKAVCNYSQNIKAPECGKSFTQVKKLEDRRHFKPRRSARGSVKRKFDDNKDLNEKDDIYQSIVEEVHNITEDPSASKDIDNENSPKKVKGIKETKAADLTKAKIKGPATDVIEVKTNVPTGWVKKLVVRKSGATKGLVDVYLYSPDGKKFRSKPELAAFLNRTKSSWKITDFDFTKKEAQGASSVKPSKKKENSSKMKVEVKKSKSPNKKESNALSKLETSKKSLKKKKASKQSKAAINTEAKSLKGLKNKK